MGLCFTIEQYTQLPSKQALNEVPGAVTGQDKFILLTVANVVHCRYRQKWERKDFYKISAKFLLVNAEKFIIAQHISYFLSFKMWFTYLISANLFSAMQVVFRFLVSVRKGNNNLTVKRWWRIWHTQAFVMTIFVHISLLFSPFKNPPKWKHLIQ